MKKLILLFAILVFAKAQQAQVTWASDIAPILYSHCTQCHHTDGIAPFPLITFRDAVNEAPDMSNDVTNHVMPPWPPNPFYSRFAHERLLTQAQINLINDWVSQGTAQGNPALAPTPPVYDNSSQLSTVSLTLTIPTYTVPSNQSADIYQCFALPTNLTQDKYITAMEVIPGNASIVHHVVIYQDTTGVCAQLDSASPGPGYTYFGGAGTTKAIMMNVWTPGSQADVYPSGFGMKLFKNSTLVLQIHYPNGSASKSDSTTINITLASNVSRQLIFTEPLNFVTTMVNGPLFIPADSVKTFEEHYRLPAFDISALTVYPHCHLVGKKWISFAVTPQLDTIPFIQIEDWQFHWQGAYYFRNLLRIPANSDLYAFTTYDNTINNTENPHNPPQNVSAGENTTDEMMIVFVSGTVYLAGDENIVIDRTPLVDIDTTSIPSGLNPVMQTVVSTAQLYEAVPNPAKDETLISYFLPAAAKTEIRVMDINGRQVDYIDAPAMPGYNKLTYGTSKLQSGTYIINLISNGQQKAKQLIITR